MYKKMALLGVFAVLNVQSKHIHMQAQTQHHAALPLLLVDASDQERRHQIAQYLKHDLSFTGQFRVQCIDKKNARMSDGHEPIHITLKDNGNALAWSLYDATVKKITVQGQVSYKCHPRAWAHALADDIWLALTGSPGFFSTRIAYCKEVPGEKRTLRHICVADYDGQYEQVLVDTPTVNIAPRWNADAKKPLLFYSEFTDKNVRMMFVDRAKRRHMACNFDGVSMLPAFSQDGTKGVFCASQGKGHPQLYYVEQGEVRQLTHNSGNNFCPTLNEDGSVIYFCSDCNLPAPSIFSYELKANRLSRIRNTGASSSPCYCPRNKLLAYCRSVKGTMQVWVYNTISQKHRQLTFDDTAKQGVSWSPCGTYIVYAAEKGNRSKLHMMNMPTQKVYTLYNRSAKISYPAWSPRYGHFPMV